MTKNTQRETHRHKYTNTTTKKSETHIQTVRQIGMGRETKVHTGKNAHTHTQTHTQCQTHWHTNNHTKIDTKVQTQSKTKAWEQ